MSNEIAIMLLDDDMLVKQKARVKEDGEVWIIHKTDEDPFPSHPHAHNYESQTKLDLSNGELYRKTLRYGQIPKKKLKKIRWLFENIKSKDEDKYGWLTLPELAL